MVADGPRAADLERVTGAPALEPIRLYAGKQDNDTIEAAVAAVMAEIDRTGALDRSVVHVTTSTGTGYVQEWSVSSLEYLTGGDVATVSMQYSFFSSALAYVTDRETPPEAGRALFEAVEARVDALPADRRPGSPQIAPVVDNGRHVRFVTRREVDPVEQVPAAELETIADAVAAGVRER